MKITNYKIQITNKFQITMTKITKVNKKRITMPVMGYEVSWQVVKEETENGRKGMVSMGNTLMKCGTMVDRV
jgi:hypothetical protein